MNTEELLSGILEMGPSTLFSGLCPNISPILSAMSFGPEPGGNAPEDASRYAVAITRKGNIAAVRALAGSPAFLPPKKPPTAAVIEPGMVRTPRTIMIVNMYMKPAKIPSPNNLIVLKSLFRISVKGYFSFSIVSISLSLNSSVSSFYSISST